MDKPESKSGEDLKKRIDELIEALKGLRLESIVSDQPRDLAQYGLKKVLRKVEIYLNQDDSLKLQFGNLVSAPHSTYYLKLADSRSVYLIKSEPVEKIDKLVGDE